MYLCLKNPMDRGAWKAMIHRVSESWTQLKQLGTAYIIIFISKRSSYSEYKQKAKSPPPNLP